MLLLGVINDTGPVEALRDVPVEGVVRLGGQLAVVWLLALAAVTVWISVRKRPRRLRSPGPLIPGIGLQLNSCTSAASKAMLQPIGFSSGNSLG